MAVNVRHISVSGFKSIGRMDLALRDLNVHLPLGEDISDRRFLPYLSQHEFEALLFVDPASARSLYESDSVVTALENVRAFRREARWCRGRPARAR